jgi:hypothetical protein
VLAKGERMKNEWMGSEKVNFSKLYQIYTKFTALKTTTLLSSITNRSKKSFAI